MRIPSGKTDQKIFFVAVDATDYVTRETGLSSFTVYRSRNGGTATAYTTPTVAELDSTNMPGVYSLLIDEDTTIASTSDSEEYAVHITCTGMAPVTRTIELYRRDTTSGQTLTVASGGLAKGTGVTGFTDLDAAGVRSAVGLTSANLDTQLSTIDTVVDAVKTKTDSLTFTVAGQVDANVQYVNDVQITGNGQTGTEWGPA